MRKARTLSVNGGMSGIKTDYMITLLLLKVCITGSFIQVTVDLNAMMLASEFPLVIFGKFSFARNLAHKSKHGLGPVFHLYLQNKGLSKQSVQTV